MRNVTGLFKRGYFIAQSGLISFSLRNKDNVVIVDFVVNDITDDIKTIADTLLKEIDYLLEYSNEKEYDLENPSEAKENQKNKLIIEELELIGDILR